MPDLFDYQKVGRDWLAERTGCILSDDCRMGKTVQLLMAAAKVNISAPILVIGPAIARSVWKKEAATWRPDLFVYSMKGKGSFRWPARGQLGVISYELLPPDFEVPPHGTIVICDEVHKCSNPDSAMTRKTKAICYAARGRGGRVWLATGTPLKNYPPQLWSVLSLIQAGGVTFGLWMNFVERFNAEYNSNGKIIGWGGPDASVPERLSRVMLRRTRAEVSGQLPKRTVQTIPVDFSAKTKDLCDEALLAISRRGMSLSEAYELASERRGAGWPELSRARSAMAIGKIPALMDLLDEYQGEPVVVMSAHRAPVDTLGCIPGWGVITGDTSSKRRDDVQELFRQGKLKGVACTIESAGVAIDLSTAAHMIFVDQSWTCGSNDQAAARIEGPRQKRPTSVVFMVSDHPIETHVMRLLAEKESIIDASIGRVITK